MEPKESSHSKSKGHHVLCGLQELHVLRFRPRRELLLPQHQSARTSDQLLAIQRRVSTKSLPGDHFDQTQEAQPCQSTLRGRRDLQLHRLCQRKSFQESRMQTTLGQKEQPRTENLLRRVRDQVVGAAALVPHAERGGLCGEEDQLQEAVLLQRVQVRQQQPKRDRRC